MEYLIGFVAIIFNIVYWFDSDFLWLSFLPLFLWYFVIDFNYRPCFIAGFRSRFVIDNKGVWVLKRWIIIRRLHNRIEEVIGIHKTTQQIIWRWRCARIIMFLIYNNIITTSTNTNKEISCHYSYLYLI